MAEVAKANAKAEAEKTKQQRIIKQTALFTFIDNNPALIFFAFVLVVGIIYLFLRR